MEILNLRGWNVTIERGKIIERGEGNGEPKEAESWILVYTEAIPPTGKQIRFEMGRDLRDYVVRELTGGIVLSGGELPKI